MPVRLKITLLFSTIAFFILGIVCVTVYLFSLSSRKNYIDARLTNVAITTGRFLSRAETFNARLVQKIDSLTAIAFARKTVQAYDQYNAKIYSFNDDDADALQPDKTLLDKVRTSGKDYSFVHNRDIIFYHYTDEKLDLVIAAAGYDIFGWQTLNRLSLILIFSFIIGVIIAIVSGYIFSQRLLRPVRVIADEVKEISAQSLAKRFQTSKTRDEWNYLSNTLNELLDRLQESFELQRRFISNASHELSTPLASISSQLDVTLQKERPVEEYKKVMQSVYEDIQHMGKLTHTLLEFAKASKTTGGIDIKLVRVDEIILRLPSELNKLNNDYSVAVEFRDLPEDEENLAVLGNQELLLTAIKNILLNACKYSEDHRAEILLQVEKENICISVTNHGRPIPAQELDNIFQPFYRLEENRSAGGFGLGLSLAKRIIKLHEGKISVISNEQETRFTIQLPASKKLNGV
jgi:two-component system, OmpR family, sensor histidine kinase ArlS